MFTGNTVQKVNDQTNKSQKEWETNGRRNRRRKEEPDEAIFVKTTAVITRIRVIPET